VNVPNLNYKLIDTLIVYALGVVIISGLVIVVLRTLGVLH